MSPHDEHDLACRTCQVTEQIPASGAVEVVTSMRAFFTDHASHDLAISIVPSPRLSTSVPGWKRL